VLKGGATSKQAKKGWCMRLLSVAMVIFLGVGHVAAEPAQIKWSDLVDKTAQSFEDPFRGLSYDQLAAVHYLEKALAKGGPSTHGAFRPR
jgi:hypothetical protein